MSDSIFKFGPLKIDAVEYGSQGNAILGIRDSGKSYTATALAEKLFEAGVPFVAFDPIGIWRFLKTPGNGKHAKGYPVVVAGGEFGDLPLTVHGAKEIVRAAMRTGVSLVIDLFDRDLSKADWRRIVTACVHTLLHENREFGLRHIFIEEAAEFIPQKPSDPVVYAEIEKLGRMGGNNRLGYTLINQRSQEIAKAMLELCENIFLHRQRGKNALESLDKWLGLAGASTQKEIMRTLPELPQGEAWAWIGGDKPQPPVLIKVPEKRSFHPDRRTMHGAPGTLARAAVDVGAFVDKLKQTLPTVEAEAAANDPKALRAKIVALTAERDNALAATGEPVNFISPQAIAEAERRGYVDGFAVALSKADFVIEQLRQFAVDVANLCERSPAAFLKWDTVKSEWRDSAPSVAPPQSRQPVARATPTPDARETRPPSVTGDGGSVRTKPKMRVLDAIYTLERMGTTPVPRARLAVVAGYSPRASTLGGYLAELIAEGLVENTTGFGVCVTGAGRRSANLVSGLAIEQPAQFLRERARLVLAPRPREIFDALYAAGYKGLDRDTLAGRVGLSTRASTFGGYIATAAGFGVVDTSERGVVKVAAWIFHH